MKSLLLVVALITCCRGQVSPMCTAFQQCDSGFCCIINDMMVGRRQAFARGNCVPLGQVSDACFTTDISDGNNMYHVRCPCADGLRCLGTGTVEELYGEVGKCTM